MVFSILFPSILFAQNPETVTDTEGNSYSVISIGEQVWMKENLRVSRYRNGDTILSGLPDSSWNKTLLGAWSVYNNDSSMNRIFGKLYNWYAVADPRGLCPAGWHVPSDKDWIKLEMHLGLPEKDLNKPGRRGAKQNVAGKMQSTGSKSDGSGYWIIPPKFANTKVALPGCREETAHTKAIIGTWVNPETGGHPRRPLQNWQWPGIDCWMN